MTRSCATERWILLRFSVVLITALLGLVCTSSRAACVNPNPNASLRVTTDFDGDCKSEIIWRHLNATNVLWYFDGTLRTGSSVLPGAPEPWEIVTSGDFNGDGRADLLWRYADGTVGIWLMNNNAIVSSAVPLTVPLNWSIVGIGDFDGDGKSDLLWRATDGTVALWFMDGLTISSSVAIANVPSIWHVLGVGDFDRNGKSDILWRDRNGTLVIWLMDGVAFSASLLPVAVDRRWRVPAVADFDGDGRADIFWRDSLTGDNVVWLMSGASIGSVGLINRLPLNWEPQGTGDFDADGKADLVWREVATGDVAVWLMQGLSIKSGAVTERLPDFDWQMQLQLKSRCIPIGPLPAALLNCRNWITFAPPDPFNPTQNSFPTEAQLRAALVRLYAEGWRGLVTYSMDGTLQHVPRIAKEVGFTSVIAGLFWFDASQLARERAAAVAQVAYIDAFVVGNEGRFQQRYTRQALANEIQNLKVLTGRPVTTSEPLVQYQADPALAQLGDWLFPNLQFWFDPGIRTPARGVGSVQSQLGALQALAPGRPIVVKEAWWPSSGEAAATQDNQAEFFRQMIASPSSLCLEKHSMSSGKPNH